MASSIAGETDFQPVHPDKYKPPLCDRCEGIAYTVYQATCCGAYFCTTCKNAQSQFLGQSAYQTCPRCRRRLGGVNYDYNETQKRKQLKVHCRNKQAGCPYEDERGRMDVHLSCCLYETAPCKHCNKEVFRKDLQRHQENCPNRMVQCQYCKATLRASHYDDWHLYNGCQDFPKDCKNKCGEKVTERELSNHKERCPFEEIPCLFAQYGCTETVQRNHMNQHLSGYKHMELLLQEVGSLRSKQIDMQRTIHLLQGELQKSRESEQLLEARVQTLNNNYSRMVLEDVGRLKQSQKDLQTQVHCNHQQLANQTSIVERNFQFHRKAVENFMDESKIIQDSMTQANTTPPFKFIINNVEELARKEDGHSSPYFYTECRRHKLRLTVLPGGKGDGKGRFVSVWLYRASSYGVPKNKLPGRVKIQVVIELISQLPHATEADNYVVNIDTIVHQDQQGELIFEKNDFIPIAELDYYERRRKFSFVKYTQYKSSNSMVFLVRSATEGIL